MSTERERASFLARDPPSRASSPGHSTKPTHSLLSTTTNTRNQSEEELQEILGRNEPNLSTESKSRPDQPKKHGLVATPRRRNLAALYRRGWTAEICSCLFALISLLGLVTTLLVHQDRPLPKWPSLITINALVSIFTSVFRSGIAMALAEGDYQLTYKAQHTG
jgi:hypothetical protein